MQQLPTWLVVRWTLRAKYPHRWLFRVQSIHNGAGGEAGISRGTGGREGKEGGIGKMWLPSNPCHRATERFPPILEYSSMLESSRVR